MKTSLSVSPFLPSVRIFIRILIPINVRWGNSRMHYSYNLSSKDAEYFILLVLFVYKSAYIFLNIFFLDKKYSQVTPNDVPMTSLTSIIH